MRDVLTGAGMAMLAMGLSAASLPSARAFDAEQLAGVTAGLACSAPCDLSGADLGGADLGGIGLAGADLAGADLSGADLRAADLRGATFDGANLRGANLTEAYLAGASFAGADLSGADLRRAKIAGAKVGWAGLTHFELFGFGSDRTELAGAVCDAASRLPIGWACQDATVAPQ